ncbi:MAG: hypothetical protein KDA53_03980 [Hyphomonas sp.]|nr:hypothetical protein [Hyphomonas sp.]
MQVGVRYFDSLPDALISEFLTDIEASGVTCDVRKVPALPPMASLEAYVPTAIGLWLAANYFSPMIREAGKSHYQSLAKAISKLFGALNGVSVTRIGTPGKADKTYPYSLLLSLEAEGSREIRFKLVLPINADPSDISEAVSVFLSFLERFHKDTLDERERAALASARIVGRHVIAVADVQNNCVTFPDPLNNVQ